MQTVIAFIIIFGSLVFFHELGHFLFAKRAGILVREFAIGMGPKIFGLQKGETIYTLRLLPIGGYVRMAGEDLDSVELQPGYRVALVTDENDVVQKIILNQSENNLQPNVIFMEVERADLNKELWIEGYDEDDEDEYPSVRRYQVARDAVVVEKGNETLIAPYDRQFDSKSLGHRFMTIFAGPLFNFILAFFIFLALGLLQGIPTNEPIISEVADEGPAIAAGMQAGDKVVEINGESVADWATLSSIIQSSPGKELQIVVERDGGQYPLTITPSTVEQDGKEFGQIGIYYSTPYEKNPIQAIPYAGEQVYSWTAAILNALGNLITGQFKLDDLSGPVGIYKYTETVATYGIFTLMSWAGMLSINLGLMNLLPLPALDGGRLLFFILEALRGKPINREKEGMVHFVGIVLLMILMVVVTWNDIQKFFF